MNRLLVVLAVTALTLQCFFGLFFLTAADTWGEWGWGLFAVVSAIIWVAALDEHEVLTTN